MLLTQKASDQYQYYQSKQLKVTLYQALKLPKDASTEQRSSLAVYTQAKHFEEQADREQDHAEALLSSFETLEIATTLFEISIAFASIAALTDARIPLWFGVGLRNWRGPRYHRVFSSALKRRLALALLALAVAAAPRALPVHRAVGSITAAALPYLPGSTLAIRVDGFSPPFTLFVSGPGTVDGNTYRVPKGADQSTLIASGSRGLAMRTIAIAPTPDPRHAFIAVASYDDGVVFHDPVQPFRARAALGIGGSPGDVAVDRNGYHRDDGNRR